MDFPQVIGQHLDLGKGVPKLLAKRLYYNVLRMEVAGVNQRNALLGRQKKNMMLDLRSDQRIRTGADGI